MRINYNVSSIIARNSLNNNDKRVAASTQRLSSGCKINSAADNAAGLAIARRMNAQIKSLQQANQNANDGLSAMNTVDGALSEMHSILQRMNELAIQSANGTNADSDREMIQKEIDQLVQEVDKIAKTTQFNAQNLLDGSFGYKAYTNSENIKVMSYSEGVVSGTYAIGKLTYYKYEDTVTKYDLEETKITKIATATLTGTKIQTPSSGTDKGANRENVLDMKYELKQGDISEKEYFKAEDANDIKGSLVTTASFSDYKVSETNLKAFPSSSRVSFENDKLVIKADNDFEIKMKVNDRTPLGDASKPKEETNAATGEIKAITTTYASNVTGSSVVTTTSYSTVTNYRNIAVLGPDGRRYSFTELNIFENADSKGNALNDGSKKIYTGFPDDNCKDLREDLAKYFSALDNKIGRECAIEINSVEYDGTKTPAEFKVLYTPTDGRTVKELPQEEAIFKLYQDMNDLGVPMTSKELEHYTYSKTLTTRTKYEVGKGTPEDCFKIDVTGMGAMIVHVGANSGQYMELDIPAMTAENLGIDNLSISTEESARLAIDKVGGAINALSTIRAKIGAYSNRLERTITNLDTSEENITAAYSRIMDVDMATEMTEYSTVQVLVQASNSMLAQANERPQQVLQLLQ